LVDWWQGPSREKREVKQKLARFDRVLEDYRRLDGFVIVRRRK